VTPRARRCAALLLAVGVAACAGKQQPAADLLGRVQVAVLAGAEDESHYAPDEFRGLQMRLAALQAAFDAKQYDVVLGDGPALLGAARTLAAEAAARKAAATQALSASWAQLAATLPDRLMSLGSRLDTLSRGPGKNMSGVDVAAARRALHDANSLWSKARSAFASGNLTEAVRTGQDVATQVDASSSQVDALTTHVDASRLRR
jgi:hypothetical protein